MDGRSKCILIPKGASIFVKHLPAFTRACETNAGVIALCCTCSGFYSAMQLLPYLFNRDLVCCIDRPLGVAVSHLIPAVRGIPEGRRCKSGRGHDLIYFLEIVFCLSNHPLFLVAFERRFSYFYENWLFIRLLQPRGLRPPCN